MNAKLFTLATLTIIGASSAGTANAYMGDGCGRDAQLHVSRHTGEASCRPILREAMPVAVYPRYAAAPVVVMPRITYGVPVYRAGFHDGYRHGHDGMGR